MGLTSQRGPAGQGGGIHERPGGGSPCRWRQICGGETDTQCWGWGRKTAQGRQRSAAAEGSSGWTGAPEQGGGWGQFMQTSGRFRGAQVRGTLLVPPRGDAHQPHIQ